MSNAKLKALQVADAQRRLSKEQLLTPRIKQSEEYIPALEGTVVLKTLSYQERDDARNECGWQTAEWDESKFNLVCIAKSLVEPELTVEDAQELSKQNSQAVDELLIKINLLNLVGRTDEVKKGSKATPSSDTDSSSPSD